MENRFSRRFFTKIVTYITLEVFILQPMLAMADGIAVDVVSGAQNTGVLMAGDTPIVNIATPSAAGLSHNRFNQFNVGAPGAVMNNSASQVGSTLAGQINGNSNLTAGSEARIILNEVTGGSRSALNGVTEIAGQQAEYILANPNGISCNGCGFINTPDVSLTTGTPNVSGGELQSLSINDGTISFDGAGAFVPNVNNFNVLARAVEVNAKIQGADSSKFNILTGRNDYNIKTGELTAKADNGSAKPVFSLDSSALGGMYAGAITLVGTETGVGVNMQGVDLTATTGALTISASGQLQIEHAAAADTVTLNSEQSDVAISGTVYGGKSAIINAANTVQVEQAAALASSAHIRVTADTIEQHGEVVAGAASDGSLSADTLSWFTAQGHVVNTGAIQAGTVVVEAGADIDNTGGVVIADQLVLDSTETLINQHGSVQSGTSLVIGANRLNNQDGSIVASGTASIVTVGDLDNSFGSMILDGTEHIDSARIANSAEGETPELTDAIDTNLLIGGQFNNTEGLLLHTSTKTMNLAAQGGINNTDGKLGSAGIMALATEGELNNTFGDIAATAIGGAFGSLDNSDGVIESGTLAIQISADANNAYGLISALVNVQDALFLTVGEQFDNTNGAVISNAQSSSVFAKGLDNTAGLISNAGQGSLLVAVDTVANNNRGDLISNGQLDLWAGSVSNEGGGINAGGFLDVLSDGELDNTSGFIEANDGLLIDVASIENSDGIISNLGFANALVAASGELSNQGGLIQSRGDNLDIDALNITNHSGVISHSGEAWLTIYGNLQNQQGEILSNGSLDYVGDTLINQLGSIKTLGDFYAWANVGISNVQGTIDSKGTVDLIAGAAGINNREGRLFAAGESNAYLDASGDINNTDGVVYSNANTLSVTSSAGNIVNNGGDILHAGEGALNVLGGNIGNLHGRILGNGKLIFKRVTS